MRCDRDGIPSQLRKIIQDITSGVNRILALSRHRQRIGTVMRRHNWIMMLLMLQGRTEVTQEHLATLSALNRPEEHLIYRRTSL